MQINPAPKPEHKKRRFEHTSKEVYEAVAQRSRGKCEDCGADAEQMHHIRKRGMGGTKVLFKPEEIAHLCAGCHRKRHRL